MNILQRTIDRITRLYWYCLAMLIRHFTKIRSNQIFCASYSFKEYACNPRSITEYILENHPDDFVIYWAFEDGYVPKDIDPRIKVVKKYSIKYLVALYTSKFFIYNTRNQRYMSMFVKKEGQKYIMTWHASQGLKQVEKDAIDTLGPDYEKRAKDDSNMCDLMLSDSKLITQRYRTSFWYNGEVLENCYPRNDIFFDKNLINREYARVRNELGLPKDSKLVLYAPTFRNYSKELRFYQIDWNKLIPYFEKMLSGKVHVLLRLHPNMTSIPNIDSLTNYQNVHNVTSYPDISEFLLASDVIISDYSSSLFDFALLERPCFIYATDKKEYDRGFYWKLEELPFSVSESIGELIQNIQSFSNSDYQKKVHDFYYKTVGLKLDGHSCERLYNWIMSQVD